MTWINNDYDYQVFIISYKRAGGVTSDGIFNNALVVIPESQEDDYRKHSLRNGCELLVIPDSADGNTVRKRNWVLENYSGCNVVIVDDDYDYIGYHENGKTNVRMTPDEIGFMIERGFVMAKDLGTVMWGLNMNTDLMIYREYSPFSLLSPILGPFQGFTDELPKYIRHDRRVPLKEDYDISLQVLKEYRKLLRFNKYHYSVNHINKSGGVVSYRTAERELKNNIEFQKKWGSKVVKFNMDKSINPIVNVPIRGI